MNSIIDDRGAAQFLRRTFLRPDISSIEKSPKKTKTPFLARCPECRTFKLFHVKLSDSLKTLTKSQTPANPHLRSPLRLSIIMQPRHIFIKVSL